MRTGRTQLLRNIFAAALATVILLVSLPARGDNHALLIGIDNYQDNSNINALSGAAADARGIAKVLQEVSDFPAGNVRVLTSDGELKPTGSNIIFELEQLAKRVKPGDIVLVFCAGHGILMDGFSYLIPWDTDGRTEGTLKRSALPTSVFQELLGKLPVRGLILAFDMCRNDPRRGARDITPSNKLTEAQARSLVVKARGAVTETGPQVSVTLFSCSPRERSWEWRARKRGYFSYYLEEGLRQGAADAQGTVRIKNLVAYLEKAVYGAVQREEGKDQTPYSIMEGVGATELLLASGRPAGAGGATAVPANAAFAGTLKEKFDAVMQAGSELYQKKQYDAAFIKFQVAIEIEPNSFLAYDYLGLLTKYSKKDYLEAERLYKKAIELNPNFANAYNNLGVLTEKAKKDYPEAKRLYKKAIELEPRFARPYNNLGLLEYKIEKEYSEAERLFKRAIELDPNNTGAYNNLGLLTEKVKKDYAEAERLYKKAIELDPENATAYDNLGGLVYSVKKDYVEAERLYKKAIELDPSNAFAHYNLGLLMEDVKKDYAEGEQLYRKTINLMPNYSPAYFNLGILMEEIKKDYAEAERLFARYTLLAPSDPNGYVQQAVCLLELGRRDEAVTKAKKAQELGLKQHLVYSMLGLK
jgi:tetratricopeptide (TPR) repeat protein